MSVKFIFKALIGTIFILVTSCIIIEMFNSFTTSYQLKVMSKVAARQACILYAQETYKRGDTNLSIPVINGITNDFYDGLVDTKDIYKYTASKEKMDNYIDSIKYCKDKKKTIDEIPWESFNEWYTYLKDGDASNIYGKLYYDNFVTPINMGMTYLDKVVVNKMYRWNLASMLKTDGSTSESAINPDTGEETKVTTAATTNVKNIDGVPCVEYKGFRVWFNSTEGTQLGDITYTMYNLSNTDEAKDFYKITSIGSKDGNTLSSLYDGSDERQYVIVATVPYVVEASYSGITPLRHLINFVNNKRVEGYKTGASTPETSGPSDIGDMGSYANRATGKDNVLEGTITYYIMR